MLNEEKDDDHHKDAEMRRASLVFLTPLSLLLSFFIISFRSYKQLIRDV